MENATKVIDPPETDERARRSSLFHAALIALCAWIFPGLGHLLLRRWGRALAFFISVAGLTIFGWTIGGIAFSPHSEDAFGTLGFLADAGIGALYFPVRFFGTAGADVPGAAGDYGTRLLAAAGLINILAVIDAYRAAAQQTRTNGPAHTEDASK